MLLKQMKLMYFIVALLLTVSPSCWAAPQVQHVAGAGVKPEAIYNAILNEQQMKKYSVSSNVQYVDKVALYGK